MARNTIAAVKNVSELCLSKWKHSCLCFELSLLLTWLKIYMFVIFVVCVFLFFMCFPPSEGEWTGFALPGHERDIPGGLLGKFLGNFCFPIDVFL